jgi:hypothetical protein
MISQWIGPSTFGSAVSWEPKAIRLLARGVLASPTPMRLHPVHHHVSHLEPLDHEDASEGRREVDGQLLAVGPAGWYSITQPLSPLMITVMIHTLHSNDFIISIPVRTSSPSIMGMRRKGGVKSMVSSWPSGPSGWYSTTQPLPPLMISVMIHTLHSNDPDH